jgi:hypothetical protein
MLAGSVTKDNIIRMDFSGIKINSNGGAVFGIKYNGVEINNGRICNVNTNIESSGYVNLIFGGTNEISISGICTAYTNEIQVAWSYSSTTVDYINENKTLDLIGNTVSASDFLDIKSFSVIKY